MLLTQAGAPVDYHTVMGNSGLAFIFQAEAAGKNRVDGAVDAGWWPLSPWGMDMRREFVGRAAGWQVVGLPEEFDREEYRSDEHGYCEKHFMPAIRMSINAGVPCCLHITYADHRRR